MKKRSLIIMLISFLSLFSFLNNLKAQDKPIPDPTPAPFVYTGSGEDYLRSIDCEIPDENALKKIEAVMLNSLRMENELKEKYSINVISQDFECKFEDYVAYHNQLANFYLAISELESSCLSKKQNIRFWFDQVIITPKIIGGEIEIGKSDDNLDEFTIIIEVDEDTFPLLLGGFLEMCSSLIDVFASRNDCQQYIGNLSFDLISKEKIKSDLYEKKKFSCQ